MNKSRIEWTDVTWNPVTGCTKVSEACEHCYAERMAKRLAGRFGYPADEPFKVTLHGDRLNDMSHWRKPRKVFVCSMADLFHPSVPDEFIWLMFRNMTTGNRRHTYQILTKRPKRMQQWFKENSERFWHYHPEEEPPRPYVSVTWPDPCLWLGATAENQQRADERIPLLLQTPAAVRFASCEPLLGPIDLDDFLYVGAHCPDNDCAYCDKARGCPPSRLSWIIIGAETGPGARPCKLEWVASLIEQCRAANVPVFVKGKLAEQFPIQEFPASAPVTPGQK